MKRARALKLFNRRLNVIENAVLKSHVLIYISPTHHWKRCISFLDKHGKFDISQVNDFFNQARAFGTSTIDSLLIHKHFSKHDVNMSVLCVFDSLFEARQSPTALIGVTDQ